MTPNSRRIGGRFAFRHVSMLGLVLALGMLSLLSSCTRGRSDPLPGRGQRAVAVTVAPAITRTVPVVISTFGTASAYATVNIRSQVNGIITKVLFQKGQFVHRGQLLFQIDPRPYQATVEQAQADLEKDRVQLKNAQIELQREQTLFDKKVASQDDLDQATMAANVLAATIKADTAAVDRAKIDLDDCSITSPIDGRAGDLLVDQGNLIKANDAAMVTINQISPIYVYFSLTQDELASVKEYLKNGPMQVQALLNQTDTHPELGKLVFVDNAIDPSSGRIRVAGVFDNPGERLWPGQYLLVKLRLTTQPNAVVIPSAAIETGTNGKYVFVCLPNDTVKMQPVVTGENTGDDCTVIERGVRAGQRVVTDGQFRLMPGSKVQIKPAGTMSASSAGPTGTTVPASSPRGGR